MIHRVHSAFRQRFKAAPGILVRAPGRVNLIGEHTDYNDGFVLPMAIERDVRIALRPRSDRTVRVYALDFDTETAINLDRLDRRVSGWASYVQGVIWALQEAGHPITGWEGVIAGDVPLGAGLSSSAALELAVARAFSEVSGIEWDAKQMALIGQRAENGWVGVQCGIMDQMISAVGVRGHAVRIDCRTMETLAVPLPPGVSIVILDSGTRRGLVDSAYNERRRQCEEASAYFGVQALRDVDLKMFSRKSEGLDETTRRRARHVVTENDRVIQAVVALTKGDAAGMGRLMSASHKSLRDDFEVSCAELDWIVDRAEEAPGCFGARMTGAGFGGCAVALVASERADAFAHQVAEDYRESVGREPAVYITAAADGAGSLNP